MELATLKIIAFVLCGIWVTSIITTAIAINLIDCGIDDDGI